MASTVANIIPQFETLHLLRSAVILVVGLFLSQLLAKLIKKYMIKHVDKRLSFISSKVLFYFFALVVILTALSELGINLKILLSAAGVLTVAIGFAAQTSMSNLISGLFLLFEKPFSLGDTVKIDDITGIVVSIDLMSTRLRTFDNIMIRIPNEYLMKGKIQNLTYFPIRRVDLVIGVSYNSKLDQVSKLLNEIAASHTLTLDEPPPMVMMLGFKESSIDLQLSVWTRTDNYVQLRNELHENIKSSFEREGIEIPFPQRVVQIIQK